MGGSLRSYRTYVPASIDPSKAVPLVVMLHGGFGSGEQVESAYGWDAKADAEGFVVVYPDGQDRAWNAGTCCGKPAKEHVDDVAFIVQIVQAVQRQQHIDPRRIFATGVSNGAMMSYRLACETKVFAAIAPVAGAQMVACDHPSPISVLHIHGAADTHVPLDGSPGNGRGKVPAHTPIDEVLAGWRKVDGCDQPTTTKAGPVNTSTATCPDGRSVTFITIDGAGHQWPGALSAGSSQPSCSTPTHRRPRSMRPMWCGTSSPPTRPPPDRVLRIAAADRLGRVPPARACERLGQRLDRAGEEVPPLEPTFRFAVSNE